MVSTLSVVLALSKLKCGSLRKNKNKKESAKKIDKLNKSSTHLSTPSLVLLVVDILTLAKDTNKTISTMDNRTTNKDKEVIKTEVTKTTAEVVEVETRTDKEDSIEVKINNKILLDPSLLK